MRIIAISDTHGQHGKLVLPTGDVLLHAGDVSSRGREAEVLDFLQWFAAQPHAHKIMIAGNHDFYFEQTPDERIRAIIPPGVTYLNDSGTTVNGLRIWGSPVSPWFFDWAFNRHRGADIKKHWDMIPADTDILIAHGPVQGILDATTRGERVGCADLLQTLQTVRPRYFVCGHIHEAYGRAEQNGTCFINASVLDERYRLVNDPVVFDCGAGQG
jgi:predicted phosphohydrolase